MAQLLLLEVSTLETQVVALFVHGVRTSLPSDTEPTPMIRRDLVELVEARGVREDPRYFRRPTAGQVRKRQVSLMDEGTLWRLQQRFGEIPHELVKSQIILEGDILLPDHIGRSLLFASGAELTLSVSRKPCYAMDLIAAGLRRAMENHQQGALARVTQTGIVSVGDAVTIGSPTHAMVEASA